jgi:hypothetical protein
MAVINNNWFNSNSTKRYPIDDIATGESDEGFELPNDLIVDLRIRFPDSLCTFASVGSINCTAKIVTVTFLGCSRYPLETGEEDPYDQFKPLAVVSIPKPVTSGIPYSLTPITKGVVGWIVFGEGIEKPFAARFSKASQSIIAPRAAMTYKLPGVTSISVNNETTLLKKDVLLKPIGDLDIVKGQRYVKGVGTVDALIFKLKSQTSTENLYKKYIGKCQGRPESESCNKISVEYLNNIQPDCAGNINLVFSRSQITSTTLVNSDLKGIAVEMPLGMAEACVRNDFLPDDSGKLPNEYEDECADVAASEGDQDAIAETGNNVNINPALNSEVIAPTMLPYADNLIKPSYSTSVPRHFEVVSGLYQFVSTAFNRGFPLGEESSGLGVVSTGSRFTSVWNDPSTYSHTYQRNYPYEAGIGVRASITFVFSSGSTTGSAGVILDYCTVYSEACSKYVKTYLIGVFNFSSKCLEVYRWDGLSWISSGKSPPISNIKSGVWYSLDFQKDTSYNLPEDKAYYRLRMFLANEYWPLPTEPPYTSSSDSYYSSSSESSQVEYTAPSSSSSDYPEYTAPVVTPIPGYSADIDLYAIASINLQLSERGATDSLVGFGTVGSGSIVFSHFFVN